MYLVNLYFDILTYLVCNILMLYVFVCLKIVNQHVIWPMGQDLLFNKIPI